MVWAKSFAPNLTYCKIFENFMGSYLMCTCFWNLKGATKTLLLIPWQRSGWLWTVKWFVQAGKKITEGIAMTHWFLYIKSNWSMYAGQQKVREHGSGALRKMADQNWGNDANWKKKNKEENKERKKDKWEMRKKRWKEKEEEEGKKQNILKTCGVTMKIVNTKHGIVN